MTTKADVLAARTEYERVAEAYLMEQPGWRVRVGPFGDVWAHCNAPNEWLYRLKACEVAMALDESRSRPHDR